MTPATRCVLVFKHTLLFWALSRPALAQSAAIVPSDDAAYLDIQRLEELGVLDSIVVGQLPFSRREFARIARVARVRVSVLPADLIDVANAVLIRLEGRFGSSDQERLFVPLDLVSSTLSYTNSVRRGLLGELGRPTEATIDPLAERRMGEPAVRGSTVAVELGQRFDPAPWLSFNARERFEGRSPTDVGVPATHAELLLGGVRARYRNVALMVGREQLAWGLGRDQGLFLASDAPALDQLSLSGDHPYRLPGLLSRLGSMQSTITFADLGTSTVRSHSKLLAYKISIAPSSSVELGGTFMNHFGGNGARASSLENRLIDFFPFIDVFRTHNYFDSTRELDVESDKVIGIDGRVRLRSLGGVIISGEWLIDDFDTSRLYSLLTSYASHGLSVTFPRVALPSVALVLGAKHKGIFTSTHSELSNGMTSRGRLLGDELGNDAKAFSAELRWTPTPSARVFIEGRRAIYSDAEYHGEYRDSLHTIYSLGKISFRGDEARLRFLASVVLNASPRLTLMSRVGVERVSNFAASGQGASNLMGELAVRSAY